MGIKGIHGGSMSTIISKTDFHSIDLIVEHLLANKLIIMPCDTIYGIVGIVPDSMPVLKMIKGREETKPFIQLVTFEMADAIACSAIDERVLEAWPGPLTVIVRNKVGSTTAIRVPADTFLHKILDRVGKPLYSTSVNVSGEVPLTSFQLMYTRFSEKIPLFVRGDDRQGTIPSTIIDITTIPYRLVREGVIDVRSLIAGSNHKG